MKRFAITLSAALGILLLAHSAAEAGWGTLHYGGYQPWWNIFAKRQRCMSVEEERLQRFWHDYYDALQNYYGSLDAIDWVSYYKNHGYQINTSCNNGCGAGGPCGGCPRIQFAPVFVSPTMNWAVPNSALGGAPCGPPAPPPGAFGMSGGPMHGMTGGMMPPGPGFGPPPYGFMPQGN